MKKIIGLLMIMAVSAVAVFAQKTDLRFYYYADASSAGYQQQQALIQKFKDQNPDINLIYEEGFNDPYHNKLSAYIAAGNIPDVMYMWPGPRSSSALLQGPPPLVKDLSTVLDKDFLNGFVGPALDPKQQSSGVLAELPQSFTYTTVLYTNKKVLDDNKIAVPKTYADLKAMVNKLKAKGIQTLFIANGDGWEAQSCLFSTISGRMTGDDFINQVIAGKAKFTDAKFVNALKFYQQMFTDGVINPVDMSLDYNSGLSVFANSHAAFYVDGDWRVGNYVTDKTTGKALIDPKRQASDITYINFPSIPGEVNHDTASAIAGVGLGINKDASGKKLEAAVKLLKFYYGTEWQTMSLETGAFIPSRKGITSDKVEPMTQKLPQYYATIPKTTYVLDGILDPSVVQPLNDGLQAIGLGTSTPAAVAAAMQKAQDAVLAKMKK